MAGLRTNLLGLDEAAMRAMFASLGEPSYRAGQVRKWIYHRQTADFMAMTDLSKDLRRRLAQQAEVQPPAVAGDQVAADGTRKWLFKLADGNSIETVYIPDGERRTLCVSSQVGCALNCAFCATARHGFNRNLHTAEIVGQVYLADQLLRTAGGGNRTLTNVVLMGMGEPLLNYDNVVPAMRIMLDDCAFGLSRRRVTLSTAGVVPAIDRLSQDCPVSLAVSLHAPDDALRDRLVPLNRKYPIRQLLDACRRYVAAEVRRKVTFEYTMMADVNDSPAQARQLAALLRDIPAKVNLIPFNPFPGIDFRRSAPGVIEAFRDVLLAAGIITMTRKTRGDDIDAACGQLAGRFEDRTRRTVRLAALTASAP